MNHCKHGSFKKSQTLATVKLIPYSMVTCPKVYGENLIAIAALGKKTEILKKSPNMQYYEL